MRSDTDRSTSREKASRRLAYVIVAAVLAALAAHAPAQPGAPASQEAVNPPQAAMPTGTLAVRAIQGTRDGGEIGPSDVEVELIHNGQSVHRAQARLGEGGMVFVRDLPVVMPVRPLVRIKYAGVMYQDVGPPMDAGHPTGSVDVTVYETTDAAPAWRMRSRHIVAQPAAGGLAVSEAIEVENPADRTWLGGPADPQGRRSVVEFDLPEASSGVTLGNGFHGWCCTAVSDRRVKVQMPLMPGRTTYELSYRVGGTGPRCALVVGTPAPCDHIVLTVPSDAKGVEARGVSPIDDEAPGALAYGAHDLAAGAAVGLLVSVEPREQRSVPDGGRWGPLEVGMVAAVGVVVLVGTVSLMRRVVQRRSASSGS
ncbi:MAG: hypothetical protein AB7G11_16655 [Phycisphaerales bacterium]